MPEDRFLLKDMLTTETVGVLAEGVRDVHPDFDAPSFMDGVFDESWSDRELKDRTRRITVVLGGLLPANYRDALDILRSVADRLGDIGWVGMVFSDFVEVFGLDDPDASIPALGRFTTSASAEFAVRPFILRYPDRMYRQMLTWTGDPDWRVRRLASEGCRPRLPWGRGLPPLKDDPTPIIPVLTALRGDPSEDVRRSVANNLNDISKDHPGTVVALLAGWQDGTPEMEALTRHALRTLLKAGDPNALRLLGHDPAVRVRVEGIELDPATVSVGRDASCRFRVVSDDAVERSLLVDLVVHYHRPGGPARRVVFRLGTRRVAPGGSVGLARKITFQQLSTRRVHPGRHAIEVQVNGTVRGRIDVDVVDG